jgi:hypothetical protein
MNHDELNAQYPAANPVVWRPISGQGNAMPGPWAPALSGSDDAFVDAPAVTRNESCTYLPRRRGNSNFLLPGACEKDGRVEFPEQMRAGATSVQLEKAAAMHQFGLRSKARRQASCRVYAQIRSCENGHHHYQPYGCRNRYCPNESCGQKAFIDLFGKYMGLAVVAERMVPHWENRPRRQARPGEFVIAKVDITIRSSSRMPSNGEVRQFNSDVRKLFRAAEKEFGLTYPKRVKADGHLLPQRDPHPGDYGVIWTDEFGGTSSRPGRSGNTNLHAHAVYCGPQIPQQWLSEQWAMIRSDGSKIVSIKNARTFGAGLYHALKYAGKFLSNDPIRLAELELTFNRVRRVHAMGGFYNAIPKKPKPEVASPRCPDCGGVMFEPTGPLHPVHSLQKQGMRDFDVLRREAARKKVLESSG